jgi:hypothetical protein
VVHPGADGVQAQQRVPDVVRGDLVDQHHPGRNPRLAGGQRGRQPVVGAQVADGDQRATPLAQRIRHQELQLAGLVAAHGRAAAVVLEPQIVVAEVAAQGLEVPDRRRSADEREARQRPSQIRESLEQVKRCIAIRVHPALLGVPIQRPGRSGPSGVLGNLV